VPAVVLVCNGEEKLMLEPLALVFVVFMCVGLLALFNRLTARHDQKHWRE
jgi:hypothetical protein